MARYILTFRGEGSKPSADVDKIRALPETTILDESLPRMIVVEGPAEILQTASNSIAEWDLTPELVYRLPGRHPLIDRFRR